DLRTARSAEMREGIDQRTADGIPEGARGQTEDTTGSEEPPPRRPSQGDTVLENAILFVRDALLMRLLTDCVKCGDSGRLLIVLKVLALYYRGCGRNNYAQEVLFLVHNIKNVWPEPLRDVVLNNWLVNPTGKANAWVEVDLLQEHFNFWIKTIYKAHGSNASWEWLAMISPCIDVLRRLATEIHSLLGAKQGTKHTSPSLDKDIRQLIASLRRFHVYEFQPGREIDDGTDHSGLVVDSITLGLQRLSEPLEQFNRTFRKLQSRCTAAPLLGTPYADLSGTSGEQGPSRSSLGSSAVSGEDPAAPSAEQISEVDGSDSGEDGEDDVDDDGDGSDDSDEDLQPQAFMSLETAADVALDMDVADVFILG
ncbi:hypothetical protein EVJ58_g4806, partial [Rhodofomes roseus]